MSAESTVADFEASDRDGLAVLSGAAAPERRRRASLRSRRGEQEPRGLQQQAVAGDASPVWEVVPGTDGVALSPGMVASRRRDSHLRRALAVSDVIGAALALCVVVYAVPGSTVRLDASAVLLAPFVVVLSKALGLYDRDQHRLRKSTIDEFPSLINLAVVFTLCTWFAEAALLSGWLQRSQVFLLLLIVFVAVAAFRVLARVLVLHATSAERVLLVGSPRECDRAEKALCGELASAKATVVGRVSLESDGHARYDEGDLPALRLAIADAIRSQSVERVVFALDGFDQEEMIDLIRVIKALGVKLSVVPRLLEVVGSASTFDDLQGLSLLGVRPWGLSKSSLGLKRAMDIVTASVVLLVLSPLLAVIAFAIKIDSPGPVFFRQRRIGRRGEFFEMLKFRSMGADAEQLKDTLREHNEAEGGLFKITEDPRITRVGGFLRRSSLDELPQLFNVLRGDMSLVGPRPLVPDEDALIAGWERRRLAVAPGMTGLWQIFGSSRIPMPEMVKIDYLYGANWSLWLDLKVLLRTVPYVARRRGR